MISLRQVEAFRAVMITGTATRAAGVLSVSQPAVSRMIAELEAEIGFKLFERANRQLIPTAEGEAFYEEVDRAFIGLDQIFRTAEAIREYGTGHVSLVTIPSLANSLVPEVVRRFSGTYPDVLVSLEVQPSQRVFERIVSRQCDIGLCALPVDNAAIESRPLARLEAVCVLPRDHSLTAKTTVAARDLEGEVFVSFRTDSIFRHMVDEVFETAGVRRVLKLQARTMAGILGLVGRGLGVSVVGPLLPEAGAHRDFAVRPFEPAIPIDLALLRPAHKPLSRIAQRFAELLEACLEESLDPPRRRPQRSIR